MKIDRGLKQIANGGWKFLWSTDGSLKKGVIRGSIWAFLSRAVLRSTTFFRTLILARILAPQDFGLFGVALLTLSTLETFSQTGFQQALIQKKENTEGYLDAAWTTLLLRGIFLFVILYFIAPYAAIFFNVPQAKIFIRVIGLSLLFRSFTNIGIIYFQKELELNKEFIYHSSGAVVDFIVTISVVLIVRSVWALVFGLLAGDLIRLIMSYLIHPYRPKLNLNLEKAKKLFSYGKWVMGSSILTFLLNQGDDALVGKLLGVTTLGLYQVAYSISNLPVTETALAIHSITFPAYSKLQDNLPKLRKAYLKVLQFTAFLSFPIAGLILVLAPDFTMIFLGEKWMPMVPTMQLLTLVGLLTSLGTTASPIFYSLGKPRIIAELQSAQLFFLAALIFPFTLRWGILGTSLSLVLATLATSIIEVYRIVRITKLRISDLLNALFYPSLNIAITILFILLIRFSGVVPVGVLGILLLTLVAISTYLGIACVFDKVSNYKALSVIRESFSLLRDST